MFTILRRNEVPEGLVKDAMISVFGNTHDEGYYRHDFMYLFSDKEGNPESFITCQEQTSDTIYLCFGSTVKEARGFASVRNFAEMTEDLFKRYRIVTSHVRNDNFPMLKIYIANGFKITGLKQNLQGETFVEFTKVKE